jgi:hypothetical protein
MPEQCYLVKLHPGAGMHAVQRTVASLNALGGRVLLKMDAGQSMVVLMNELSSKELKRQPQVSFVGGVHFTPRPVRIIRCNAGGDILSTSTVTIQSSRQ